MNNQNVAHAWANKIKSQGNGSNFYFKDYTIYSYGGHFPIAKHVSNAKGKNAILFTTEKKSVSTSKHINYARGAIPKDANIIYCTTPNDTKDHYYNLKYFLSDYKKTLDVVMVTKRKNTLKMARMESKLFAIKDNADKYCKFFGIKKVKFPKATKKEQERLIASHKAEQKRISDWNEKQRIESLKTNEDKIKEWKEFKRDYLGFYNAPTLLRINKEKNIVESSHGADVTIEQAKYILPMLIETLALCTKKTKAITYDDKNIMICHFKLLKIDQDNVTIGCHVIPNDEIIKLWFDLT